ncbi:MAG: hypothetical protein AAGA80_28215, partial [Cyanobacteria bacterium P01_F01_bin.143]
SKTFKISDMGLVKVIDFQKYPFLQRNLTRTRNPFILGTPYYCSPEQIKDPKNTTAKADIYSLGLTVHRLLTKESTTFKDRRENFISKFNCRKHDDLLKKIEKDFRKINKPILFIRSKFPDVPLNIIEKLSNIVIKMLDYDPDNRPESMENIRKVFLNIRDDLIVDTTDSNDNDVINSESEIDREISDYFDS